MELKIARQIARLSRQELASRAGIDLAWIVRLENGDPEVLNEIPYRAVVHVAQALGVLPTTLFPVKPLLPTLPRLIDDPVTTADAAEDPDV